MANGHGRASDAEGAQRRASGITKAGTKTNGDGARGASGLGLHIPRLFTTPDVHPYDEVEWERRNAQLVSYTGKVSFEQNDVEFPSDWSLNATNIVAEKYFRGKLNTPAREWSVKQIIDRVVDTIAGWGEEQGRFAATEDRDAFTSELKHILVTQKASFNSPVWFNIGVPGRAQQASACFILHVDDSIESIADWYRDEMFIFQGGSGSGLNVSNLRSSYEQISVGGHSSGPVTFMRGADASAGTIKSGGATRRAAKMVVFDVSHPDLLELRDGSPGFVWCKAVEEKKARALKAAGFDMAVDSGVDAYSIQYQNANNSVRVTDEFMQAYLENRDWHLRAVTTGDVIKTYESREVMRQMAQAAWECADPGMQYHSTINDWHTAPAAGPIRASNPCSEYMHIDNSPCNLASINLLKFLRDDGTFDTQSFEHTVYVLLLGQAILCVAADYPTDKIGTNARGFRQLGIGYANLGALLMALGAPYDSDEGRAWAAAITSLMQGAAYRASARFAEIVGPYPGTDELPGFSHPENRDATLRVLRKHAAFSKVIAERPGTVERKLDRRVDVYYTEVAGAGRPLHKDAELARVVARANEVWAETLELAELHGVENSQVSVLAPTGTIGFMMDCDTTGVEPDLALKKVKKLVGGGTMSIVNQTLPRALRRLGYNEEQIEAIVAYVDEHNTVVDAPALKPEHYDVFACSFTTDNLIGHMGHIKMMAAVQPFLSGAISKTVNVPETASVEDMEEIFVEGWRLGLKAVAMYRDNCKADQPLSAESKPSDDEMVATPPLAARRRMPRIRQSVTYSFRVADTEGYFHVGLYPDTGQPGELFIKVSKQGSTLQGVMADFALAVSMGLQHGVPLATFVEKFMNNTFEPHGITDDPDIRFAKSLIDYIFKRLALDFLPENERSALGIKSVQERKDALDAENGNGNGGVNIIQKIEHGEPATRPEASSTAAMVPALDAPLCSNCGTKMRPAGSCFACESCGSTSGCS